MAKKKTSPKKASPKKVAKKATKAVAKPAPKKAAKAAKPKAPAAKPAKPARKPNPAFMVALNLSPALSEVVGAKALPRTEIIKKIWEYIRKNDLQDKANKRMINADAKLKVIFDGKDQVSMFELAKVVNNHAKK